MYNSKFVVAIKSKGNVLKEFKDNVYIKFGSEYSIFLKNLNTKRAIVNISVDGNNVSSDGLVIGAGEYIDLERSISNNNLKKGNRFKFIERTENIEKHRGIGAEDGIISVEFQFEKQKQIRQYPIEPTIWGKLNDDYRYSKSISLDSPLRTRSINNNGITFGVASASNPVCNYNTGITVAGSESNQQFVTVSSFDLEDEKHVIILRLLGETEQTKIEQTVTVKTKQKCTTCGKVNKVGCKFCSECGTALEIY